MKKVVILGANEFQWPLIKKAKELGYKTYVFAWEEGSVGAIDADFFYPISITKKEEILCECNRIHPDAVVTIGSDLASITVQYLAEKLGLPGNSYRCELISTNKYEMRKAFAIHNIPVPQFVLAEGKDCVEKVTNHKLKYPLIVKPTDRSGSRGITKVSEETELVAAVDTAVRQAFQKKAIIEEFIEGNEYSCECITSNGTHHFLALTKKFTTGSPHYIETAHLEPSGLDFEMIERVKDMVFKGLNALEITQGASHSEVRIDKEGNVCIIEIGSRMGGDCIGSDLVPLSTGYDYLQMVLNVGLGQPLVLRKAEREKVAYIRFVHDEADYNKYRVIQKKYPQKIYKQFHLDEDEDRQIEFTKVVDSGTRKGYYIITCENLKELEEMIDEDSQIG